MHVYVFVCVQFGHFQMGYGARIVPELIRAIFAWLVGGWRVGRLCGLQLHSDHVLLGALVVKMYAHALYLCTCVCKCTFIL